MSEQLIHSCFIFLLLRLKKMFHLVQAQMMKSWHLLASSEKKLISHIRGTVNLLTNWWIVSKYSQIPATFAVFLSYVIVNWTYVDFRLLLVQMSPLALENLNVYFIYFIDQAMNHLMRKPDYSHSCSLFFCSFSHTTPPPPFQIHLD